MENNETIDKGSLFKLEKIHLRSSTLFPFFQLPLLAFCSFPGNDAINIETRIENCFLLINWKLFSRIN